MKRQEIVIELSQPTTIAELENYRAVHEGNLKNILEQETQIVNGMQQIQLMKKREQDTLDLLNERIAVAYVKVEEKIAADAELAASITPDENAQEAETSTTDGNSNESTTEAEEAESTDNVEE